MALTALKFLCRCRLVLAIWAVLFAILFGLAAAAPPPNDLCAGAEVIPGTGPFPYWSLVVPDITGATTDGDPTLPSSGDCHQDVSRGIWYKFTPSATGVYVLSVDDTATTVRDTFMAIYTSAGACNGPFVLLACNDDAGITQSAIATNLAANSSYYIVVWKVLTNAPLAGEAAVQLKVARAQVPANDLCAGAENIPAAGPFPYFTVVSDTLLATTNSDPPLPTCLTTEAHRSVWYRFTPMAAGVYVFTTAANTATRVFDTLMGIYTSSGGCAGPFSPVACNDDVVDFRAATTVNLAAGTTYYIVVWDSEAADPGYNTVQLAVWRPGAPTVATLTASSISSTMVALNSLVTPNSSNEMTRAWFEWGANTSYGNITPMTTISSNLVNVPLTRSATVNPTPNVMYHYRAAAGNSRGTNYGADRTFVWSNTRPQIGIAAQNNGTYRLQFTGNPGQLYRLQASVTLTNWADLGMAADLGNGSFEYIDFDAVLSAHSFYRVRGP